MKIIYGLENFKQRIDHPVVTIGIFDGVHLGHQDIIRRVVCRAQEIKSKSLVLTFDPHPLKILTPENPAPLLISLEHRLRLIAEIGAETCLVIKFDKAFSQMIPEEFVKDILVERLSVSYIFIGENFSFGKSQTGALPLLRNLGKKYNFKVVCIRLLKLGGKDISSTRIRSLIERGLISQAAKLLGRPVSVLGTVIKGTTRGRLIGYPTANIDPHHEVMPPAGVYAVKISMYPVRNTKDNTKSKISNRMNGKELFGISNIGIRPTFARQPCEKLEPTVEVHIFDFNKNIYGHDLEVYFIKRIRDEKKFANKDELVRRIKKDEKIAKDILFPHHNSSLIRSI